MVWYVFWHNKISKTSLGANRNCLNWELLAVVPHELKISNIYKVANLMHLGQLRTMAFKGRVNYGLNFSFLHHNTTKLGPQRSTVKSSDVPGDCKPRESPDEADIVWRLFVQILFR